MSHMIPKMLVWITFNFEGFHQYDGAPLQVEYLKGLHRHLFFCEVGVYVDVHGDRVIEFHMLKNKIVSNLPMFVNFKNTGSCESIAKCIVLLLQQEIDYHVKYRIEVSEDQECGATLDNS